MNFRQQLHEAYEAGYRSVLNEQVGTPYYPGSGGGMPSSWSSIINSINNHMELVSQGARPLAPELDYDGNGQVDFSDLTIALSLWARGIMPVNAQDYQAGALIIDDSGLGEPIPPEGEELLNVLSGGDQNSLGMFLPVDAINRAIRTDTRARQPRDGINVPEPGMPDETGYHDRGRFSNVSARGPQLGMGGPPAMPGGMG